MPIVNLDKLKISLDKFNEVADGTYNIGQLKLSDDGKSVYRTNNHKTWKIFNNTKISPEESLAIKQAFCNAFSTDTACMVTGYTRPSFSSVTIKP